MAQKSIKLIILLGALFIAGCSAPEPIIIRKTVEVKVPVYTPVIPPAYLLAAVIIPALPIFYKPTEKNVTSCLKLDDEIKFKQTIYLLSARINEWQVFASPAKVAHD